MFEIECPTCEERFSASREPEVGAKLECPKCGELLKVVCDDPLEISYWDDEGKEDEDSDELLGNTPA